MFKVKDIYMKACHSSDELHQMTDEERELLQRHLREMYVEIEKVCDRHGLRMMVAYGTALGALRHQGFIPWDDDLDLLMPREDYDRLINENADELPEGYKIFAPNSKNGPICRFAKVVDTNTRFLGPGAKDSDRNGIFIDIFALENTPVSIWHVKLRRYWICGLEVIASCVQEVENPNPFYKRLICSTSKGKRSYYLRWVIGKIFSFSSSRKWFERIDRFVQYKKKTGFLCVPTGESGKWRYFQPYPKELYLPVKRMQFDDIDVYVPNCTERHCEIEYGDWRYIPKEEERWEHFISEIRFDRNKNDHTK